MTESGIVSPAEDGFGYDIPASPCLNCGSLLDAATQPDDPSLQPKPGELTMCTYCGAILVFDEEMRHRLPTPEENEQIERDPRVRNTRELVLQFRHKRRRDST